MDQLEIKIDRLTNELRASVTVLLLFLCFIVAEALYPGKQTFWVVFILLLASGLYIDFGRLFIFSGLYRKPLAIFFVEFKKVWNKRGLIEKILLVAEIGGAIYGVVKFFSWLISLFL